MRKQPRLQFEALTDAQGAAIAGATITLTSTETNAARTKLPTKTEHSPST
ncbi:MAG: hypothetical protein WKF84_18430 [Pyrinomonadaceae bacterium]